MVSQWIAIKDVSSKIVLYPVRQRHLYLYLLVKVEHVSNFKLTNDRTIPCIINYVAMCNSNIHHRQWCKIISGTIAPLNDQAPLAMYIPQDFPDHDLACTRSLESSTPFICLKICILIYIYVYIYIQELKIHDNCCSKCFFATAEKSYIEFYAWRD